MSKQRMLDILVKYEKLERSLSGLLGNPKCMAMGSMAKELDVSESSLERYLRSGKLYRLELQEAEADDFKCCGDPREATGSDGQLPHYWCDNGVDQDALAELNEMETPSQLGNTFIPVSPTPMPELSSDKILYIPDTQIKAGADIEHIRAVARYAVAKEPSIIVFAGDWHDMPSLSMFNTRHSAEGLRVESDIKAGNDALDEFMFILTHYLDPWEMPEIHITLGNHSAKVRIARFIESHPELEGTLKDTATPHFEKWGIIVHDFLDILTLQEIRFSHYIVNPHSLKGSPLGGACDTMLKNCGFSFVMGHQQGLKMAKHYLADGTKRLGIVAGSFYPHDEDYMSVQANKHWRGIIMLNDAHKGGADICEVSLHYLMSNYGDNCV